MSIKGFLAAIVHGAGFACGGLLAHAVLAWVAVHP